VARLLSRLRTAIVAALCATPSLALAHPHVWIEAEATLVVENAKVAAVDLVWRFDPFFSGQMQGDFDRNRNGKLDPDELEQLTRQTQLALKQFSFFTHLHIGKDRPRIDTVENFRIEAGDAGVAYRFRVPLPKPIDPQTEGFAVGFYDETYFADVQADEARSVRVIGDLPRGCALRLGERAEEPIYFGSIYPKLVKIACNAA